MKTKIQSLHHWTPTLESMSLGQLTGKRIWLKMECYQSTGSFKIRGIGRLCEHYVSQGITHLVASSGGNAGIAVAYAARMLGVSAKVFIPKTSQAIYIDAIKAQGAEVIVAGNVWDETHEAATQYAKQHKAAYIPPFDHPLIWSGHATIIDELVENNIKPDAIISAVGGGGLACGLLEGMQKYGWNDIPLIAVETEGAASFAACIKAKRLVKLDQINTIATSLGAKQITAKLWEWYQQHPIQSVIVNDKSTIQACYHFLNQHRVLLEPASGAALAPVYEKSPVLENYQNLVVIVCGGVGLSFNLLEKYLKQFGLYL